MSFCLKELRDEKKAADHLTKGLQSGDHRQVGQAIREVLEARHANRAAFARRLDMHASHLYAILDNDVTPRLPTLIKILDEMGFKMILVNK